jgi:glycosyltransferase involved in cell wall biosynthesis
MISIIIPTYNRGSLISETIDSVLNQTFKNIEVIVVDDHSSDNTKSIIEEIIKEDSRVSYYIRPDHLLKGGNSCRNYGLKLSKGDFIKWLDSDDLLLPTALEEQFNCFEHGDYDLSICESLIFRNSNPADTIGKWGNISQEMTVSNFISGKIRWGILAGLWKRDKFTNEKIWKEGLNNSQEWLMHLSQLIKGVSIIKLEKPLCLIRSHDDSMSSSNNKTSSYYYNECYARFLAIGMLTNKSVNLNKLAVAKLKNQFLIYHFFVLYRGSIKSFLNAFKFYPTFISFILKEKN